MSTFLETNLQKACKLQQACTEKKGSQVPELGFALWLVLDRFDFKKQPFPEKKRMNLSNSGNCTWWWTCPLTCIFHVAYPNLARIYKTGLKTAFSSHFRALPQHNQVTTLSSGKMHYGECRYRINHMSGQAGEIFFLAVFWRIGKDGKRVLISSVRLHPALFSLFEPWSPGGSKCCQEGLIRVSHPGARQEKPPRLGPQRCDPAKSSNSHDTSGARPAESKCSYLMHQIYSN